MSENLIHIQDKSFYKLLLGKTALPVFAVFGVGLLYVILMSVIDHRSFPFPVFVVILTVIKTLIISRTTLRQLSKMIKICHSHGNLLWVFGLLIGITIFSFATDYTCLYLFDHSTFEGVPAFSESYIYNLYYFIYFSVITFFTVGYGDIVPVSGAVRFVVILEIYLSFFIIIFALANIKKIHIYE